MLDQLILFNGNFIFSMFISLKIFLFFKKILFFVIICLNIGREGVRTAGEHWEVYLLLLSNSTLVRQVMQFAKATCHWDQVGPNNWVGEFPPLGQKIFSLISSSSSHHCQWTNKWQNINFVLYKKQLLCSFRRMEIFYFF